MDWNNMQTWHYFALIAGGVLVLGVILYFLPVGKVKVPSIVTAVFAALGVGLAAGIIFMGGFGYKPLTPEPDGTGGDANGEAKQGKEGMGMPKMGMAKGPGGPGGAAPKGGFGPTPRAQLAALVNTLDNVVDKPVSVNLSAEERAAIAAQLKGLDAEAEVKDDDARARLEAILKVVEKDRKALESMGYRWPGTPAPKGGFGGGKDNPNPFKEGGPSAERLKSLMDRLGKK